MVQGGPSSLLPQVDEFEPMGLRASSDGSALYVQGVSAMNADGSFLDMINNEMYPAPRLVEVRH